MNTNGASFDLHPTALARQSHCWRILRGRHAAAMRVAVGLVMAALCAAVLVACDGGGDDGAGGADRAVSLGPQPKPKGTLLYATKETAVHPGGIYAINADGTGERRLTRVGGDVSELVRSPDGRKIAFVQGNDIYIRNADGTGKRRLTRNGFREYSPSWSPDGKALAFGRLSGDFSHVHVTRADGSGERQLTESKTQDDTSAWSPDGRRIAFTRALYDDYWEWSATAIYVMNADGTGQRRLTTPNPQLHFDYSPSWSPDGRTIAFERGSDIYLMNADGTRQRRLEGDGENVSWSPDGRRIGFTNVEFVPGAGWRKSGSYIMNADGTGRRRLGPGTTASPAWSPDGRIVALVLNGEIHVLNPDGSGRRRLTFAGRSPSPIWSADGRTIVFIRSPRPYDADIYVMRGDGRGKRALTRNETRDGSPAWSPDGRRIAYVSGRESLAPLGDIALMDADGSDARLLTRDRRNQSPAWSPDGRRIAFVKQGKGSAIYVMGADGSHERRVTSRGDIIAPPAWSPDGRKILFVADPGPSVAAFLLGASRLRHGIYIVNADGHDLHLLTEDLVYNDLPAWSPDGRRIAFEGRDDRDRSEIYVMNANGFDQQQLTEDGPNEAPAWSPNGRRIAFVHEGAIHVMDADGENRRRLTSSVKAPTSLSWSPDGKFIVFATGEPASREILVVSRDGTSLWRLTRNTADDWDPTWQPLLRRRR